MYIDEPEHRGEQVACQRIGGFLVDRSLQCEGGVAVHERPHCVALHQRGTLGRLRGIRAAQDAIQGAQGAVLLLGQFWIVVVELRHAPHEVEQCAVVPRERNVFECERRHPLAHIAPGERVRRYDSGPTPSRRVVNRRSRRTRWSCTTVLVGSPVTRRRAVSTITVL